MIPEEYIEYRSGYKHQLATAYEVQLPFGPEQDIYTEFIVFLSSGLLIIRAGYCWDGASGPVPDTKRNMRASLIHDALYQLLRQRLLPPEYRELADKVFRNICKEDKVWSWIASTYYKVLKRCGAAAASPDNKKKVHTAPKRRN